MQAINAQYDFLHERLSSNSHCANDEQAYSHGPDGDNSYSLGPDDENFSGLKKGDFIFINNTLSEVLEITTESFRVVARGRNRQTWFNLNNGVGRYNSKLRASFNPIPRPSPQKH